MLIDRGGHCCQLDFVADQCLSNCVIKCGTVAIWHCDYCATFCCAVWLPVGTNMSKLHLLVLHLYLSSSAPECGSVLLSLQPVMLFNPGKISSTSRLLLERGIAMVVVGFPATPLLSARARICISASHSREDLDWALQVGLRL